MTPRKSIDIAAAANKLLGFKTLLPGQREAIQSLLEGRDTLLVQPAGLGKWAVYRIAGALLGGPTAIVSPLIALQKDPAEAMEASGPDVPAVVNTLSEDEHEPAFEDIQNGNVEYIFLAPEQLRSAETIERLKSANVSLFVVDEAHCISHWGHDFRPDYLGIARVIESLEHPRVLALTTTASREVREEIVSQLGMNEPRLFVHGFDRPNISLRVDLFSSKDEKYQALLRRVEFADKPGIVYVSTHKNAETIAADLQRMDVPAVFYHGGLKPKEREEIQKRFMSGDVPVIVATNAFGMGVTHKPDIRFVYHADVSDSVDGYYQEIGRSGRDGEAAEAVLFYRPQDISSQSFKTGTAHVDSDALEAVYNALLEAKGTMTREELSEASGFSSRKLVGLIQKLEESGAIAHLETGEIEATSTRPLPEVIEEAERRQQFLKDIRRRRLQQMQQYAECRSCRREFLLRCFGQESAGPCGNCDRCEEKGVLRKAA